MPTNFRAKPTTPVLNRAHPLMRGLRVCYPLQPMSKVSGIDDVSVRDLARQTQQRSFANRTRTPYGWGLTFPDTGDRVITGFTDITTVWSYIVIFRPPTTVENFEAVWFKRGTGTAAGFIRNGTTADSWGTAMTGSAYITLTDGEWHHVAGGKFATTLFTVGDGGKSVNTGSDSDTIGDGAINLGDDTTGGLSFSGDIAFFALWDRQLSRKEIADHYADPWEMLTPRRAFIRRGFVGLGVFPDSWHPQIERDLPRVPRYVSY